MNTPSNDSDKRLNDTLTGASGGIKVSPAQQKVINSMDSEVMVKKMASVLRSMLTNLDTKKN